MTVFEGLILIFNIFPVLVIFYKECKQEIELEIVENQLGYIQADIKEIQRILKAIQDNRRGDWKKKDVQ